MELPSVCTNLTRPRGSMANNAFTERWTVKCAGGLIGGRIHIAGLNATNTDVLVRLGLPWSKSATECARVHRKRSVQVRIAEERPCRKISARVGRVWRLVGERFFCGRFVERAGIRWHLLLSPYSQPDHASGESRA